MNLSMLKKEPKRMRKFSKLIISFITSSRLKYFVIVLKHLLNAFQSLKLKEKLKRG